MFSPMGPRSANAYKKIGVETSVSQASAHDLVAMLFDGLLVAVGSARAAMIGGDIKTKCANIVTAVRILEEGLKGALNLEQGGELAANLQNLYAYCVVRLTQANARNDVAALEEVQRLIEPVAAGWKQMGQSAVALPGTQLKAA
jgi:flagellar secretion chaperone FliS